MTLDASGNFIVGTTSAIGRATVVGGGTSQLSFHDGNGGSSNYGYLNYGGSSGELTLNANSTGGNTLIRFLTSNGGSNAERARIDSSGNLLVGTTSVISSGKVSVSFSGATQGGANFQTTTADANTINFINSSGTAVGRIYQDNTSTSYITSSDYRLKNTIESMTGALAKVALLKPCTYKWNVNGSDGEGFIAHELAEVVPQCVSGEKDAVDAEGNPKYQGIDVSFLVATLTAAIQEQQAIIESLKARLDAANL
jgi:hypothetical protein